MTTPGKNPAYFAAQAKAGIKLREEDAGFIPRLGDGQATLFVALTTLLFAYAGMFGFVAILAVYAMWFSRVKYRGAMILKLTPDAVYVLLFATFACLSFIWSKVPNLSLYSSLEYTSSILVSIIIARIVRTKAFLHGFCLGTTAVLIASIASGRYGIDPFSGNYSLVGLFGSKNQVGLFAELGIFLSMLSFLYRQSITARLFYCLIPLGVSAIALYLSKSAASVLSLFMVFAMIGAVYVITRLPRAYRTFACVITVIWFTAVIVAGIVLDWQQAVFGAFGKDSTMTGRTVLWEKGMQSGWHAPIVGHGYSAFWVQGNPLAEQLWYQFEITGRSGFHFHNMFVETFVELGLVGVFLISLLYLQNLFKSFSLTLKHGLETEYLFALGISVMFIIRACVEVDLVGTFGIAPILVMAILPRLATHAKEQQYLKEKGKSA